MLRRDQPAVPPRAGSRLCGNGFFSSALRAAGEALLLAKAQSSTALAAMLQTEINLYEAGQPCRAAQ